MRRRYRGGPAHLCRSQERDHAPRRFIYFVGSSFWGQRIKGDWRALLRRRVDFFANVRVVDCFPFGEIFLRAPCAKVWPRQRRAQADAFIEPNTIKLARRATRRQRRRDGDERRDSQRRPHEGKPIPNSKPDGSMPTPPLPLLQPSGLCNGTRLAGFAARCLALSCFPRTAVRGDREADHLK